MNNNVVPISFTSRVLQPAEKNYTVTERELLDFKSKEVNYFLSVIVLRLIIRYYVDLVTGVRRCIYHVPSGDAPTNSHHSYLFRKNIRSLRECYFSKIFFSLFGVRDLGSRVHGW